MRAHIVALLVSLSLAGTREAKGQLITRLEHDVVASRLEVSPSTLYVPKNIPGSLRVELTSASGEFGRLGVGTHVEGVLRGPGFPAHRLLGLPDEPLLLPPIALVGEYRIDDLRLVDTTTGQTLLIAEPNSVTVHVFPEVLVSQVESRPLSFQEIEARGVVVDETRFSAYEFEVAFSVDGQPLKVQFPVVRPAFLFATEVIPLAEVASRRVEAERINRELIAGLELPPQLRLPGLDVQIESLGMVDVSLTGDEPPRPIPMPAIMVIPGNVGFLNQFFSVQVYVANAAPVESGLSVHSLEAELVLPAGRDLLVGTADDPLRPAETTFASLQMGRLAVRGLGVDGQAGTADDSVRFEPGETGRAEFLVEGRREGLHTLDLRLYGRVDGFAAGEVPVEGHTVGSVLVRNPRFSLAFTHPEVVRAGEPYSAAVTVLNTGEVEANLVTVNLRAASLIGAELAPAQGESVTLGAIPPGESRTVEFRLIARRTGKIGFGNISGDDGLTGGRFDLTMAIGERGVVLSAESLVYPEWVDALPEGLRRATDRVLGQALSVATAGILPPGVRRLERSVVQTRVLELAEAGQRLRYGDVPERVYLDLWLDWVGGRSPSLAFDQILRETDAGLELRQALGELLSGTTAASLLVARAPDLAARGEGWFGAASGAPNVGVEFRGQARRTRSLTQALGESSVLSLLEGDVGAVRRPATLGDLEIVFVVPAGVTGGTAQTLELSPAGPVVRRAFSLPTSGASSVCYRVLLGNDPTQAVVDNGCDQTTDGILASTSAAVTEAAPMVISVEQDLGVRIGRPRGFCEGPTFERLGRVRLYHNYGTLVAVLFNKPMDAASLQASGTFMLDNGVPATGVAIQRGGRVALVNLSEGLASFRARQMVVAGASDLRGSTFSAQVAIGRSAAAGVSIAGRVIGSDGNPAANVPVTLTMTDFVPAPLSAADDLADWLGGVANPTEPGGGAVCDYPVERRISQVRSDGEGRFELDYVMAGLPYRLSATDVRGLNSLEVEFVLETSRRGEAIRSEAERLVREYEALANQSATAFFSGVTTGGRVAVVEGVDRAVFDDQVRIGSPRYGSEVPVALRFRGRGVVAGRVLASNGVDPVAEVAVNLIPEGSSREQARGLRTNDDGSFRFEGVPLGAFTLQAEANNGARRAVAGRLSEIGEVVELDVVLASSPTPFGRVVGRVLEADGLSPIPGAQVQVRYAAGLNVPAVNADGNGDYRVERVPFVGAAEVQVVAVAGGAFVRRTGLTVIPDGTIHADLIMPGRSEVEGRVERSDGSPVAGALVAGGAALVTTDASGYFLLSDVPVGTREIAAGVAGAVPRFGRTTVQVLPNARIATTIVLDPIGQIGGTVRNANGTPVPNVQVAIPVGGTFRWVAADNQGHYLFPRLSVGSYTISAPAPLPHSAGQGASASNELGDAAGIIEAALLAHDPSRLSAEAQADPLPGAFGFTTARIDFDGQLVGADITYLPTGGLSGTVVNHQGRAIGADVVLSALALNSVGQPQLRTISTQRSDGATGAFSFSGVNPGPYTLSARTPLYNVPAEAFGTLAPGSSVTGVTLQFGQASMGRLAGVVTRDGTAVGAGAVVRIDISPGYELLTDASGRFDTQIDVPVRAYRVEALEPSTGREGSTIAVIAAGATTEVEVPLLRADGALTVLVQETDGSPAPGVDVAVDRAGFPERSYAATTNGAGRVDLSGLVEGSHSVAACAMRGQLRLCTRGVVEVLPSTTGQLTLTLAHRGTIRGRYVESDGVTPVGFVQVELSHSTVGRIGFASGDAQGVFEVEGVPIGVVTVLGRNPVTGRSARQVVSLAAAGDVREVLLREEALGQVIGRVIGSDGATPVSAAAVTFTAESPLFEPVRLVAGPNGQFAFPSVPPGPFRLSARDPVDGLTGTRTGVMPTPVSVLTQDVALEPRASLPVHVVEANGVPLINAEVRIGGVLALSNAQGDATVGPVPLGSSRLTVRSTNPGRSRSAVTRSVNLTAPGPAAGIAVQLPGVGRVRGTVRRADNSLVVGGSVTLRTTDPIDGPVALTALTGADGRFDLGDVALGSVTVEARDGALAGSATGSLSGDGQVIEVPVTLGASAEVRGRLVRADGTTPVPSATLHVTYSPPSGFAGAATTVTAANGQFSFGVVPVGPFTLSGTAPGLDGVLAYWGAVPANVTIHELGDVFLDEARPEVVEILPLDGATEVSIAAAVEVTFSEPMDPSFAEVTAAYVTNGMLRVPLQLSWAGSQAGQYDRLVLTPNQPLEEETEYSLVVLGAAGSGGLAVSGPTDLAGRALAAPFVSRFRTRDSTPPVIDSFTPLDGQAQLDPSTVVRVAFNEAVRAEGLTLTLSTSSGPVPGTTSLGLDGRVAVFTPNTPLAPNGDYQASLAAVVDLAGNSPTGLPVTHNFRTLDTLGPQVTDLRLQDNLPMIQGTTVTMLATLAGDEPGVELQLSPDLSTVWTAPTDVLSIPVFLDRTGPWTFWARAIDTYGNYGPWYSESYSVVPNLPPQIALVQVLPVSGPLVTGQPYLLRAEATDDAPIARITARVAGAINQVHTELRGSSVLLSGTVPSSLVPGVTTIMTGEVEDSAGVVVVATPLALTIIDGTAPIVSMSTAGVGAPGQTVTVQVQTTDAVGVVELLLETSGALVSTQGGALSPPALTHNQTFNVTVPVSALGGSTINLLARAIDSAGNETVASGSIHVDDVVPPTVASISPLDGAISVPRGTFVDVVFSEPVTGVTSSTFLLSTGGLPVAATVSQPLGPNSARLAPNAGLLASTTYQVSMTAGIHDLTGLSLVPVTFAFSTESASIPGPQLVSVTPVDTSTNIALRPSIRYTFDAPILASSVQSAALSLIDEDGATVALGSPTVPANLLSVEWRPAGVLQPGRVYVARLAGTITDASGHAVVDPLGRPFGEYGTNFTTAAIELTVPGGNRVIERIGARATLVAQSAAGVTGAHWMVDGMEVGFSPGSSPSFALGSPALNERPSGTVEYAARVVVPGGTVEVPSRTLTLEPYGGDFDADGLGNGAEAAAGLDPWSDDANQDPDGDGLSNAAELALGTSPFNTDTDRDGLADPVDPAPLSGNRPPAIGVARPSAGLQLSANATADLTLPEGVRIEPPLTWELWVRPSAVAPLAESTPIFHSSDGAWAFVFDEVAGRLGVTISGPAEPSQTFWGPPSLDLTIPHHVAFTHDGQRAHAYVDGRLVGTGVATTMGYLPAGVVRTGGALQCRLDELRLWNVALDSQTLALRMHRPPIEGQAGLFGYWSLDDLPSSALDQGGRGLHGNLRPGVSVVDLGATHLVAPAAGIFEGSAAEYDLSLLDLDAPNPVPGVGALPQHGALFASAVESLTNPVSFAPRSLPSSILTYVVEPGFVGVDSFELTATDGLQAALPTVFQPEVPASKVWIGGSPGQANAWNVAANWSPAGVPVITDRVEIPAGTGAPISVSGPVSISGLTIGAGRVVDVGAQTLTITGHVTANEGQVMGTGLVVLSGRGAVVHGHFPNVRVDGSLRQTGDLVASGNLSVSSGQGASLEVGVHQLVVHGDLGLTGRLAMLDPMSWVEVDGDVNILTEVASGDGHLEAGTMLVRGDFRSATVRRMRGAHEVVLAGTATQTVYPPLGPVAEGLGHFHHLTIRNPAGVVVSGALVTRGRLRVEPGSSLSVSGNAGVQQLEVGAGASLTAASLAVAESADIQSNATVSAATTTFDGPLTASPTALISSTTMTVATLPPGASVTNLILTGVGTLTGDLTIAGDLEIGAGASLDPGPWTLVVGGQLRVRGALLMSLASARVEVAGSVVFGDSTAQCGGSRLDGGRMVVHGGLESRFAACFRASGTHRVELVGSGPRVIHLVNPSASANSLAHLEVRGGSLNATSRIFVGGSLTLATQLQTSFLLTVVGTSVFEGGAALTGAQLDLLGGFEAAPGSSVAGTTVTIGSLTFGNGNLTATNLNLRAASGIPSGFSFTNLRVQGPVVAGRNLTIPGNLDLPWATESRGDFDVGGNTVVVGGNFIWNGRLRMSAAAGVLDISGNISAFGIADSACPSNAERRPSMLTAGELRARGNVTMNCSVPPLIAEPGHRFVLAGTTPQSVSMQTPVGDLASSASGGFFGTLVVANTVGVTVTNNLRLSGDLLAQAGASLPASTRTIELDGTINTQAGATVTAAQVTMRAAPTLVAGQVTVSSLNLLDGATSLPPWTIGSLTLRAPVVLTGNRAITGLLTIENGTAGALTLNGHVLTVGGGATLAGPLVMNNSLDLLAVAENVTLNGPSGTCGTGLVLQAGTLSVGGNFSSNSCTVAPFVAGPNHTTVMTGSNRTISWGNVSQNGFGTLEVAPGASVSLGSNVRVVSTARVGGTLTVPASRTLTALGTLNLLSTGTINNNGTITVLGACVLDPAGTRTGNAISCP